MLLPSWVSSDVSKNLRVGQEPAVYTEREAHSMPCEDLDYTRAISYNLLDFKSGG